jgi:hypothetical protein
MCTICRKFKKGSLSVAEAREELEEQIEYLSEEHIEEVEELLFQEEDMLEYMQQRRMQETDEDDGYDDEGYDEELPNYDDEYDIEEEE